MIFYDIKLRQDISINSESAKTGFSYGDKSYNLWESGFFSGLLTGSSGDLLLSHILVGHLGLYVKL